MGDVEKVGKEILRPIKKSPLGKLLFGDESDIPEPDPLPIPDPPIVSGQEGEGARSQKKKLIKSGRGGSILAGSLTPKNIGKQTLG